MADTSDKNRQQYCYRYPHPALTADCVIFGFNGKSLKVLLVERGNEPYLGCWALPGGFMHIDESIEEAAERELREETNLRNVYLEQFKVFSRPDRDPRERVVTVAFIALVKPDDYEVIAGDDASNALWFDAKFLPPLAFDHREIIREAREHLKEVLRLKPVAFELLNKVFTISELQNVYEVINEASYDRRNFLRTAIDSEAITEVKNNEAVQANNGRPVKFYTASPLPLSVDPVVSEKRLPSVMCDSNIEINSDSDYSKTGLALNELPEDDSMLLMSDDVPDWEMEDEWIAMRAPHSSEISGKNSAGQRRLSERKRMKPAQNLSAKSPTKGLFDFFRRK